MQEKWIEKKIEHKEGKWLETPLQTMLGLALATCKQLLETKYLQKHVRNKPENKNGLRKTTKY